MERVKGIGPSCIPNRDGAVFPRIDALDRSSSEPYRLDQVRAFALSDDGNTVVGWSVGIGGTEAVRWTPGGGMQSLGDLPGGGTFSIATDVSDDGNTVVGTSFDLNASNAFIWSELHGMRSLESYLTE